MLREIRIDVRKTDEAVLAAMRTNADADGICWTLQSDLAELVRCDRSTIWRSIRRLKNAKLIEFRGDARRRAYKVIPQRLNEAS